MENFENLDEFTLNPKKQNGVGGKWGCRNIGNISINLDIHIHIYRAFSRQKHDSGHYKLASTKLAAAGGFFVQQKHAFLSTCLILLLELGA